MPGEAEEHVLDVGGGTGHLARAYATVVALAVVVDLTPEMLAVFETGVRYQMYHALGLLAVAWASSRWPENNLNAAGWAFIVGIIIFSGSLYILSIFGIRWLGAITPIGGLAFLIGWAILVWSVGR